MLQLDVDGSEIVSRLRLMVKHFAEAFEVLAVGQKYARNDSNFKVVVEVPFDLQMTQRSHS